VKWIYKGAGAATKREGDRHSTAPRLLSHTFELIPRSVFSFMGCVHDGTVGLLRIIPQVAWFWELATIPQQRHSRQLSGI
jgi:hypothetical protein